VGATGLATNPNEYRDRLREQPDEQLDSWTSELLRDIAKRRGVVKAVADIQRAAKLDESAIRRVFARGGGVPATVGKDAEGHLIVPAIALHFLVTGLRSEVPDARDRLIAFLVASFDEIVYV
jgi:chorismate mutase